jgi:predicted nucleic acid-binding protein
VSLLDDIPEGELVALDTAVWIYEVEANPSFAPIVNPFFRDRLAWGRNLAGSSLLALGELLVQPLAVGRADLVNQYRSYFTTTANFSVWEVSRQVVERAAALRAKYRLKMIDAVHVATAILNRAPLFRCNDRDLRRVTELKILVHSDYLPGASP